MNALRRFILAVRGIRAPHVQDDDDRPWSRWADDEEDPSFKVIRAEARLRFHDDVMAEPKEKPRKLNVITTSNMGGREAEGPTFHSLTEPEPRSALEPAKETLRERWRRWSKKAGRK